MSSSSARGKNWVHEWMADQSFHLIHRNNLVYNACWEDPRVDRKALQLNSQSHLLVLTSAGCNVLDYLLDEPRRIDAVDMNPHQTALLELKLAGLRHLDFEEFFMLFGRGSFPDFAGVYRWKLRDDLSPSSQKIWDRRLHYFDSRPWIRGFYDRGTSGLFARLIQIHLKAQKIAEDAERLFAASSLEEQREIYDSRLAHRFWTRLLRFGLKGDLILSLLGVPRAQRCLIDQDHPQDLLGFLESCLRRALTEVPARDNYFWWLYLAGGYTRQRCPEYLKEGNFNRLKSLIERVHPRTASLHEFLETDAPSLTHAVLLDHMDWLQDRAPEVLRREWKALFEKLAPGSRLIWRSGGKRPDFVNEVKIGDSSQSFRVGERLHYDRDLAESLHCEDRVQTYGSFAIADIAA